MVDCKIMGKSGPPGGQQQAFAGPGGAISGKQSHPQQIFKQGAGPASHAIGEGTQQGARFYTPTRAVFSNDGKQQGLSGHHYHRGSVGVIGAFPGTTASGARSSVAHPIN